MFAYQYSRGEFSVRDVRVGNARLELLAKKLDTIPRDRFDYGAWVGEDWGGDPALSCGTTACGLGWATTMPQFRRLGLVLKGARAWKHAHPKNLKTGARGSEAADVAGVCREIVMKTASTIQGRKYVRVEGWQAIAVAYGCVASARDVANVYGSDGKLLGVKAIGEVRRMSDGVAISTAEGFVGVDEPTWFGGRQNGKDLPPRAMFAVRAMAQTRSESRACRGAFSFVVTLIDSNLATTPAEEMEGVVFEPGNTTPPAPAKTLGEKLGAPPRPSPQSVGAAAAQHADQPPAHTDANFRPLAADEVRATKAAHVPTSPPTHDRTMTFRFGNARDTQLHALTESDLKFYEGALKRDIASDDAKKVNYRAANTLALANVQAELRYRGL